MSVVRAFIAIDLPPELRESLARVVRQLREQAGDETVRWVPAENVHLTLKFLGDVSLKNLPVLQEALQAEAMLSRPFEFSVGQLGAFPKIRQPRVIWAGVESPLELMTLQKNLETRLTRIGYPAEERPFSPHLTLGRVSRSATPGETRAIADVLSGNRVGFLGAVRAQAAHIYRSDLRPSGPVYSKMFSAAFGEK